MKSTSSAIWWIKDPNQTPKWAEKKRKQSVGATFSRDMADLFRNISMHAYSKLVDNTLNLWEKLIWLALHMTTMCVLLVVLSLIWEQFVAQYIVISLFNPLYPVESVRFPSISICPNNRISYQAALTHAKELSEKDPKERSVDYFMKRLKYLIDLYPRFNRNTHTEDYSSFQSFLDAFDTYDNETFFNTRRIAEMLSPSCKNFIRNCKLGGHEIDCFKSTAFQNGLTSYGLCCTFNTGNYYAKRSFRDRFVDSQLGLRVVLNTSHQDDFMSILNIDGYIVIVHDSNTYPDTASGESHELYVSNGEESSIELRAFLINTEQNLRSFSPQTRKCYFEDEFPPDSVFRTSPYSFSDCITRCRMRSMLALCNCIPFYVVSNLLTKEEGIIFCTLQHVACLLSYNFKWNNVLTQREISSGIDRAYEEALYCPECLPACNNIQYEMSLAYLPIDLFMSSATAEELKDIGLQPEDISVLKVYFDEAYSKQYKRLVGNTWYEALCTVGNVTSIFLGFSILAVFECGFFIAKYIVLFIKTVIKHDKRIQRRRNKKNAKKEEMTLYICP